MLFCIHAKACRFTSDKLYLLLPDKFIKGSHGIAAAAHTGDHSIRKSAFLFLQLLLDLFSDDFLEIADNHGEGVRPHNRPQHIQGVIHPSGPFPHGLIYRILQSRGAAVNRVYLRPQKFHAVYIQSLAVRVLASHEDFTFKPHKCCRSCGNPVLSCSRLSDDSCFAHLFGKEHLSQDIVDLVGTCVI